MKQLFNSITVLLFITVCLLLSATTVNAQARIKVITYNVGSEDIPASGPDSATKIAFARNQMRILAEYLKNNQIDIAILQEMDRLTDLDPTGNADDLKSLLTRLTEIGYPMEAHEKPYAPSDQKFRVVIVSRYSAVPGSLTQYDLGVRRWAPSIAINSPIGTVRVVGAHTRVGSSLCNNIAKIGEFVQTVFAMTPNVLVGADFNVGACSGGYQDLLNNGFDEMCGGACGWQDRFIAPDVNMFDVVFGFTDPSITISEPEQGHFPIVMTYGLNPGYPEPNPIPTPFPAGFLSTPTPAIGVPTSTSTPTITPGGPTLTFTPTPSPTGSTSTASGNMNAQQFMFTCDILGGMSGFYGCIASLDLFSIMVGLFIITVIWQISKSF